ncbi:MAG: ribonuclease III [Planctomycetaceae bacterium]
MNSEPSADRESILRECQVRIGYQFQTLKHLERSLTHSSCATTRLDCNERMEFLGDAVLGLVICETLYHRFPERREGQLTQHKSHLVSRAVCAQVCKRLGLQEMIFVGKGLQSVPDSLKAAAVESVIAAIYLDGGYSAAHEFILRAFGPELENCTDGDAENYKSLLQEETQRDGNVVPSYLLLDQRGPDHAREFLVAVAIGETQYTPAWGRSKKEAEQKAAMHALEGLAAAGTQADDPMMDAVDSNQARPTGLLSDLTEPGLPPAQLAIDDK